ncbi:hypothetical protein [Erythrobacter crassostreae]|uniref:Ribosomal RNA large subunit methyltransferase K/L-like methyltransferase domain-containing protein n=1 Tax=Erythrobacter crassostreae TaxID=2828328 RepID=A0A9X1F2Z6_9SPHN|nr:hypothetical protein [Erythrobacter crassostrea]MBV7259350.1 hypothetical protein [Erythrobacter crassostrea]
MPFERPYSPSPHKLSIFWGNNSINAYTAIAHHAVLAVPPGLEAFGISTARREYGLKFKILARGFIQSKDTSEAKGVANILDNAPLWTFGSYRLVGQFKKLDQDATAILTQRLRETVNGTQWGGRSYWLDSPDKRQDELARWARSFMKIDFGLINNPSNYSIALKFCQDGAATYALLGKSISVRERFAYRRSDVGASINPVLAACLARMMPAKLDGMAIDPTCGSGTLLFERLRYSQEQGGLGIDVSKVAQEAFTENLRDAGLGGRDVRFQLGSSIDAKHWQSCSSVTANLPFGIRVREKPGALDEMYRAILGNAQSNLADDGRILLTSSYRRGLEGAAHDWRDQLKLLSRYRAEMGGLHYQIFVFGRR